MNPATITHGIQLSTCMKSSHHVMVSNRLNVFPAVSSRKGRAATRSMWCGYGRGRRPRSNQTTGTISAVSG